MEAETFNDEAEADHHQEAKTEDNHCRMLVDEVHEWAGCQHHYYDSNDDGNHHHWQMLHHTHRCDHTIEREDSIEYDDLNDNLPEDCMCDACVLMPMCTFKALMQLHRTLGEKEQTTDQHNEIAARERKLHHGDQRFTQRHDPGDRSQQRKAHQQGQRKTNYTRTITLMRWKFIGQNGDKDEIVDAENNF